MAALVLDQVDAQQAEEGVDRVGVAVVAADEDRVQAPGEPRRHGQCRRRPEPAAPGPVQEPGDQAVRQRRRQLEDRAEPPPRRVLRDVGGVQPGVAHFRAVARQQRHRQPPGRLAPVAGDRRVVQPGVVQVRLDQAVAGDVEAELAEGVGVVGAPADAATTKRASRPAIARASSQRRPRGRAAGRGGCEGPGAPPTGRGTCRSLRKGMGGWRGGGHARAVTARPETSRGRPSSSGRGRPRGREYNAGRNTIYPAAVSVRRPPFNGVRGRRFRPRERAAENVMARVDFDR